MAVTLFILDTETRFKYLQISFLEVTTDTPGLTQLKFEGSVCPLNGVGLMV